MGQCHGCIRYILFIFNFFLWLLGCALLSVGIWLKMDDSSHHHVQKITEKVDEEYQIEYSATGGDDVTVTLAYLLIFFGIVLIIITFVGCCGAVRENICLLAMFIVCLVCLMASLVGVGIWAYVQQGDINTQTEQLQMKTNENLRRAVKNYYVEASSKDFLDKVHERFRCCGIDDANTDFFSSRIPRSCHAEDLRRGCDYYYFRYVSDEIADFLDYRYSVIVGVAFGVAVVLGLGVGLAVLFAVIVRRATSLVVT